MNTTNHSVALQCCQATQRKMSRAAGHLSKSSGWLWTSSNVRMLNQTKHENNFLSQVSIWKWWLSFQVSQSCPTNVPNCFCKMSVDWQLSPAWFRDWNNVELFVYWILCPGFTHFDGQIFMYSRTLVTRKFKGLMWVKLQISCESTNHLWDGYVTYVQQVREMFLGFEIVSHFFIPDAKIWNQILYAIKNPASNRGCTCEHLGHRENNAGKSGSRWADMGLI